MEHEKVDGPVATADGAVCATSGKRCRHFGIHDWHYYYCAAQDAENKHAKPGEYAYPWPGAGVHLPNNEPNAECPFNAGDKPPQVGID